MKVIFLDIDGVLNTSTDIYERRRIKFRGKRRIPTNKKPKRVFAKLVEWMLENDIYFVMSTSWRGNSLPEDWNEILKNYGVDKELVISITPFNKKGIRGIEILEWLDGWNSIGVNKLGKEKVVDYVVIDDDIKDIKPFIKPKSRIIQTNVRTGLVESDLEKIIFHFEKEKIFSEEFNDYVETEETKKITEQFEDFFKKTNFSTIKIKILKNEVDNFYLITHYFPHFGIFDMEFHSKMSTAIYDFFKKKGINNVMQRELSKEKMNYLLNRKENIINVRKNL